jgi:hypothetical protein
MAETERPEDGVDWRLTTWEGARREQLRRWAALLLERIILALEEMQDVAERLSQPDARSKAGRDTPIEKGAPVCPCRRLGPSQACVAPSPPSE